MGKCWLHCENAFFLKKTTKQHVQYNAIFVKNDFIYVVGWIGKNHPSLSPSVGGQESKWFNHSWHHSSWHKKNSCWQPVWLFLWISQVSGLARKSKMLLSIIMGWSVVHKRQNTKTQAKGKNVLSLLPDQPAFPQRKIYAWLCKKGVLTLQVIYFKKKNLLSKVKRLNWY